MCESSDASRPPFAVPHDERLRIDSDHCRGLGEILQRVADDDVAHAGLMAVARERSLVAREKSVVSAIEDDRVGHRAEVVDDHRLLAKNIERMSQ